MMSINMQFVDSKMQEISKSLTARDFNPYQVVVVRHDDQSELKFTHAFCSLWHYQGEDYLMVFTEHNGHHLFSVGDLVEEDPYLCYKQELVEVSYHSTSPRPSHAESECG